MSSVLLPLATALLLAALFVDGRDRDRRERAGEPRPARLRRTRAGGVLLLLGFTCLVVNLAVRLT